ncbi:Poly-beta-hydroxybutyrate polymerase [Actinomadura rubteroloni]|uniref:Poly-beta-hydroxybutyrate polymerase n=1 Tax=Actinomadura rubteroloni TaxID=1926885 RepID=A0A2P4UCP7_9ACTN|nr:alpha/beta fold hydrolase [Actinomadura rubteroloni]POM22806.1 Poly-beta-hydroxybutyrate polymerase [Actinomadura rubteroloni]
MIRSPRTLRTAAVNVAHKVLYGGLADLRPMPADTADGSVRRYRPPRGVVPAGPPVLFVPSPAAPARCYDLRRGCSLAEHVVNAGRLSNLLDPGADLDLETLAGTVLPDAVREVSAAAGGQPVQLVGWCLGGLAALLAAAADPDLPIASVAVIATPVDAAAVRRAVPLGGGMAHTALKRARRLTGIDNSLLRPYRTITHLDDAEFLAQAEAVDHFANIAAGPSAAEIYRTLLRGNAFARDGVEIAGRRVGLDDVRVPVLAVAGEADEVAPVASVRPLTRLLPRAPQVRFAVAPGGHLGVLTGRSARRTTWAHLGRWLDEGTVRHGIRAPRRVAAASG